MSAEVNDPKYAGVSVHHPRIKEYVLNMTKRGETKERISKIVGMPEEVVTAIQKENKGK